MERTRLGDARDPVKSFVGATSDRLRITLRANPMTDANTIMERTMRFHD